MDIKCLCSYFAHLFYADAALESSNSSSDLMIPNVAAAKEAAIIMNATTFLNFVILFPKCVR